MLGVLGFYVLDSAMMLCSNEMVFSCSGRRWGFSYPRANYQFLGRTIYIPNPLTPYRAVFRVYWSESEPGRLDGAESLPRFIAALMSIRGTLVVLLFLFFVVLPLVLFFYGSGSQLLWLFGAVYLNIIVLIVQVYRVRKVLGVSNKSFLALSFESLLCAPFALNILRKISLHYPLLVDPVCFAKNTFAQADFHGLADLVLSRIDDQLELEAIVSTSYQSLQAYRAKIKGMV